MLVCHWLAWYTAGEHLFRACIHDKYVMWLSKQELWFCTLCPILTEILIGHIWNFPWQPFLLPRFDIWWYVNTYSTLYKDYCVPPTYVNTYPTLCYNKGHSWSMALQHISYRANIYHNNQTDTNCCSFLVNILNEMTNVESLTQPDKLWIHTSWANVWYLTNAL